MTFSWSVLCYFMPSTGRYVNVDHATGILLARVSIYLFSISNEGMT